MSSGTDVPLINLDCKVAIIDERMPVNVPIACRLDNVLTQSYKRKFSDTSAEFRAIATKNWFSQKPKDWGNIRDGTAADRKPIAPEWFTPQRLEVTVVCLIATL
ncbi:MAG: hypothetical protein AAGG48_11855 [Planctomycetota bacterium]